MAKQQITKNTMKKVLEWFGSGRVGMSSEAIALNLTLGTTKYKSYPHDPSDFNRCLMLIKAVPELKENMHKMSKVSDKWEVLIENWEGLESCFINEVGENWSNGNRAPITYKAMKGMGL